MMTQTMQGIAKHLIVVSYDAFSEDNWEQAKRLTNLAKLIAKGAYSTQLKSVYPTMTYVIHSTMVTGVYPDKHGVIHNNPLQPFVESKNQAWHWYQSDLNVPTIYDVAKQAGLKTAGIMWPVTGRSSLTYNFPEIVAVNDENQAFKVLRNGSPFFCLNLELKFGRIRKGVEQPYLDDFSTACAVDTIKRKKPNLLLLHLIDLDDTKHKYGTDSEEVKQVIERMDHRLGDLIEAVEEAGIADETAFIVLGDHGQFNVNYKVYLNNLLKEKGLIFDKDGKLEWRAYFQSTGGSAYLHVKKGDDEAEQLALEVLEQIAPDQQYGIEQFYERDDLDRLHVDRSISYMVEAKQGYSFEDGLSDRIVEDLEEQGIKHATHGYSPDKDNYHCNLVISGDKVNHGLQLAELEMVDIAPTIAKILGLEFTGGDGRSIDEAFQQ